MDSSIYTDSTQMARRIYEILYLYLLSIDRLPIKWISDLEKNRLRRLERTKEYSSQTPDDRSDPGLGQTILSTLYNRWYLRNRILSSREIR